MKKLYPLTLNLQNKNVVIIGAGKIALRKVQGLIDTGANITVISPQFMNEFELLNITLIKRDYQERDLDHAHLIFIATDNVELNRVIAKTAKPWQWVNDVSDSENSNCYNPAIIRKSDLIVAISTENQQPKRAKQCKEALQPIIEKIL